MRVKLIIIVVLLVGILGIITASLFTKKKPVTLQNVCTQAIDDIQNYDYKGSYNLFSADLKKEITLAEWKAEFPSLNAAYSGNAAKFISQSSTGTGTSQRITRVYHVTNNGTTYNINCYLVPNGKTYAINGYTSQQAANQ